MDFQGIKNDYLTDGYAIIRDFLNSDQIESLLKECSSIVENMNPPDHCTVFHTQRNQDRGDYFVNSGDKISFFFEKDAVDENGHLIVGKHESLNKIGHALHWLNPVFKQVTFSNKIKDVLHHLDYKDPVIVQSMFIFKHGIDIFTHASTLLGLPAILTKAYTVNILGECYPVSIRIDYSYDTSFIPITATSIHVVLHPEIGGVVTPHQDSTFLYTEPPSTIGFWFPLVDVTLRNGCLWFIPGSHKGKIYQRYVRNPKKEPFLELTGDMPRFEDNKYVPVLAKKGDCILIHGSVIHKSGKNLTDNARHVYTFHAVEKKNTLYSKENWLQPTENLPFPSVY